MVMAIFFIATGMTVLAGSINEHEQRILDTVSTPVTYKGKEYIAKEQYVTRLVAYMNQDNVDLTKEQADTAIKKFIDSIEFGIKEGYMEEVKSDSGEKGKTPKKDGKDKGENTNSENTNSENTNSGNTNSGNTGNENRIDQTSNNNIENNDSSNEESDQIKNNIHNETEIVSAETSTIDEIQNGEVEKVTQEEETDIHVELEMVESSMEEVKDYSDAEPYQKGISLGMFAIIIVIVVALTMLCIILAHKSRTYKRK